MLSSHLIYELIKLILIIFSVVGFCIPHKANFKKNYMRVLNKMVLFNFIRSDLNPMANNDVDFFVTTIPRVVCL